MNIIKETIKPPFPNVIDRRKNWEKNILLNKELTNSTSCTAKHVFMKHKYISPLKNVNSSSVYGPRTSSTYTRTAGTSTNHDDSKVLLALSEGRGQAAAVVGIACMNVNKPNLILCQISDSLSYIKTLTKINIFHPNEILIPATFIEHVTKNRLLSILQNHFPNTKITSVPRNHFKNALGMQYIKHLCASEFNSVLLVMKQKFYALAATSALLKYIEQTHNIIYTSNSIKVEYKEPENTALIDIDTADRLELVSCRDIMKHSSLLAILNHCCTNIGKRLLRSTILQPPCLLEVVNTRLDCVQEILENPDFHRKLRPILLKLFDVDYLLMFGMILPQCSKEISERQLNYTLRLKSIINSIEPLTSELITTTHPVFRTIYQNLMKGPYKQISKSISSVVQEDAHPAKGQAGDIQRCFAIKNGINGLLDVARKTYTEIINNMREYVEKLASDYNLPLRVNCNIKKGFHIVMVLTKGTKHTKKTDLPPVFIQVERYSNSFSMTTETMVDYAGRIKRILREINSISNVIIYELLCDIKPHISCLYKLCDDIALLDVLQSLAQASVSTNYIRPEFSDYMELKEARHPLLDFICLTSPTTNNTFASEDKNFHIITGPNMSGKSIYIRQIILIQIMAQVGSYVPAEKATLRLANRIFARIGLNDNFECNASSFILEMKEMQFIFNSLTSNSLIIIDELCRSTSHDEGTSIAGAMCEKLIKTKAFTFLATHFLYLATFTELYFNVSNWQMETIEKSENNNSRLQFTYNLKPDVTTVQNYGLKLAKICAIPNFVIERAKEILSDLLPLRKIIAPETITQNIEYLKYQFTADLKHFEKKGELSPNFFYEKIQEFKMQTGCDFDFIPLQKQQSDQYFEDEDGEDTSLFHSAMNDSVNNTLYSPQTNDNSFYSCNQIESCDENDQMKESKENSRDLLSFIEIVYSNSSKSDDIDLDMNQVQRDSQIVINSPKISEHLENICNLQSKIDFDENNVSIEKSYSSKKTKPEEINLFSLNENEEQQNNFQSQIDQYHFNFMNYRNTHLNSTITSSSGATNFNTKESHQNVTVQRPETVDCASKNKDDLFHSINSPFNENDFFQSLQKTNNTSTPLTKSKRNFGTNIETNESVSDQLFLPAEKSENTNKKLLNLSQLSVDERQIHKNATNNGNDGNVIYDQEHLNPESLRDSINISNVNYTFQSAKELNNSFFASQHFNLDTPHNKKNVMLKKNQFNFTFFENVFDHIPKNNNENHNTSDNIHTNTHTNMQETVQLDKSMKFFISNNDNLSDTSEEIQFRESNSYMGSQNHMHTSKLKRPSNSNIFHDTTKKICSQSPQYETSQNQMTSLKSQLKNFDCVFVGHRNKDGAITLETNKRANRRKNLNFNSVENIIEKRIGKNASQKIISKLSDSSQGHTNLTNGSLFSDLSNWF